MLRSAAAAAAAAPGPPSGAASFPPPGASRASAGDGRGGRGGRRPPPPPPRHLLPPPRLPPLAQRGGLGARGAPCWRRLPPQKMPRRAPGRSRARRPGRRAPAGGLARRALSLARSLTASPQPDGGAGPAGLQRTPGGKVGIPTKRRFTRCGRGSRPSSRPPPSSLCALECFPAWGRAGRARGLGRAAHGGL